MSNFEKTWITSRLDHASSLLTERLYQLRSALRSQDPGLVAARSGISYLEAGPGRGELHIQLWGNICILSWPELTGNNDRGEPLSDFQQTLLLYYLVTADDSALTHKWVSFADLPGGRMYNTAFQGYSGDEIEKNFGMDLDALKQACDLAGGEQVEIGNASFIFQALPRVPLMLTYWLGDEDFPSSCKILFDESACHYLPIDACAILGSTLTRRLIRS
jgi:hypothetical protein